MSDARTGERTIRANGISMHVLEAGPDDGPLVVLSHGFPELSHSWRHQLPALADAGFHAVAPDQRGYGSTEAPEAVEDYDILHLTADLTGLLDAFERDTAVFVGHDWGAIVVWSLALLAPERVRGVAALSVPFTPRPPIPPTELMKAFAGDRFFYILYFQEPEIPERELDADPRRTLRVMFAANSGDRERGAFRPVAAEGTGFLDTMPDDGRVPPWLTDEDLNVYAAAFERGGFRGPINWYRNFDRNWELTEHLAGAHVTQPALFVTGERDPVRKMTPAVIMRPFVDDLRGEFVLPGCGHWTQQEQPDEVNRLLLGFLQGLPGQ